jgi:CelD/BcsL family acetyltransferase involved in cellulose biosynthesis
MTAPFWIMKSVASPVAGFGYSPARPKRRRLASESFGRDGFSMRTLSVEQLDDNYDAWRDLVQRSLEPNGFFEPGFALSLARHSPAKSRPQFVAVWRDGEAAGEQRRLVGLFPLTPASSWSGFLSGGGLARLWLDKQTALAAPLLDRDCAEAVVEQFLDWLAKNRPAAGVVFPRLVKNGPIHRAILNAARGSGRVVATLDEFERAMLSPGSDADELWLRGASKKALKDLHRRQRRLAELGAVEFSIVSSPQEVRDALEQFLTLEASGWKGKSGALLSHPALSAFVRSATRMLARENKCSVARLTLAGRPLAMGVVIESRGRAYFWKIAFDEAFRAQAPGIHLLYELTRAQAARADIDMTDSCAIANHPMIDRFWPDRLAICDVAVQSRAGVTSAFDAACRADALRRSLRASVKRMVKRLLGRKES